MGLMMKNLNIIKYYGVHWKIWFLKGVVHEKRIYRGNCLKRGLSSLQMGAWQKEGVVFWWEVDTPMQAVY